MEQLLSKPRRAWLPEKLFRGRSYGCAYVNSVEIACSRFLEGELARGNNGTGERESTMQVGGLPAFRDSALTPALAG
jgi:hypothetical protein